MTSRPRKRTRVVAPSAGYTSQTRLRVTVDERSLLVAIGEHLSAMRVTDLSAALAGARANDRAKRLMAEFGVTSRYAESACADNDAAVKAARECLWNDRAQLRAAIVRLERRTAAPPRNSCGCGQRKGCERCRDGYATGNERAMKRRRLDILRGELARVERHLARKHYPIVLGTGRLLNTRHHLVKAGLSEDEWRARWQRQRAWFGAIGNTGKVGGNPCLTLCLDDAGRVWLRLSVPRPIAQRFGVPTRVQLRQPVRFSFLGEELADRVRRRLSTRFDIQFGADRKGRPAVWLRAAWRRATPATVTLSQARESGVVGVDFNADHFAVRRLDPVGNPVGSAVRVRLDLHGGRAQVRDGRLREALSRVIDYAVLTGASAIAVEDLAFSDEEKSRESYGRRRSFRQLVSGFATAQVAERLPRMAARQRVAVIAVHPAYTSRYGGASWQYVLANSSTITTRHDGAAVAIGRRALGHGLIAHCHTSSGQPRQRSVPHQSDGRATGTAGQGRAPASPARPTPNHSGHHRDVAVRRPSRRPSRPANGQSGVESVGTPPGRPKAGYRFTGASAPP